MGGIKWDIGKGMSSGVVEDSPKQVKSYKISGYKILYGKRLGSVTTQKLSSSLTVIGSTLVTSNLRPLKLGKSK